MTTGKKAAPANTQHTQATSKKDAAKNGFFSANDMHQPFFEAAQVRAKMTVNQPGDHFEKQADYVADKVVKQISQPKPVQPATVQKKGDEQEDKKEKELNKGEKEVQRKPVFESDADPNEGNTLKRSSQSAAPDVSPQTQHRIESSKGGGEPLPTNTREEMEGAMGTDLGAVRVHHGNEAADLSSQLQAQAFTHGNDIYFGQGKYDTQSQSGQHLLAHELTHTVQQGNGVKKKGIQRTPGALSGSVGEKATADAPIDTVRKTLYVPTINIPAIKAAMIPGSKTDYAFKKTDRSDTHIAKWNTAALAGTGFDTKFNAKKATEIPREVNATNFFITLDSEKGRPSVTHLLTGSKDDIKSTAARPFWDDTGAAIQSGFDVDHKVELQLGGMDDLPNLWMLDAGANRSSGSNINTEITSKVDAALTAITTMPEGQTKPSGAEVRNTYTITAGTIGNTLAVAGVSKGWELSDIEAGKHLDKLAFLSDTDRARTRLTDRSRLSLITSARFGATKDIPWDPLSTPKAVEIPIGVIRRNGANLKITNISYTDADNATIISSGSEGTVTIQAFMVSPLISPITATLPIEKVPGIYGGRLNANTAKQAISAGLRFHGLSPINLLELDINDTAGLIGNGKIMTDVPMLNNAAIDIVLDEDGIKISKIFNSGEIRVPPPFTISNSSLEVFAATTGLGVRGEVNFEITNLGHGQLGAMANTTGEFALTGSFDFDSQTFNPAHIEATYRNGAFTAAGDIGIPEGKIRGLKTANIHVGYANDTLTATGTAEPDIRGVRQANINVSYGEGQLVIGGGFQLDENIPGIQSGSGTVQVTRGPDGIYHVTASGTAVPRIPHINTSLSINYDDGALTLEGTAAYTADRVSGNVTVGATNRAIGADGTPSGPAGEHFTAYGSGSLTLRVTDWLQATATVRLTPAGEIEVVGRLELPSAVDVFPRKAINKNLFTAPTIQIPLFAIPLGPRSIGLVATINGGLDFEASVGPGQLRNVFGQIEFNPSHPENTRISGGAQFVIPAHAGVTLHADLGIGLSVAAASVTGGIEIRGGLGLEGEASASADLAWSPTTGFEFNALGQIDVHPKFTFDVNALLRASLDLGVTSLSKEWRHNLAAFSYGPDIQLGVSLPVHYKDGEPFDISTDDIQVTYPHIDIPQMAGGLADQISSAII